MRGLGKIIVTIAVVTGGLLLYVHERVEMLRASYRIYQKSSSLSQKAEEYRRLSFEVAQLRSPEALEKRLREASLALTVPKEIRVIRVPEPLVSPSVESLPVPGQAGSFFDFVGQWIQVAQARTDQ